VTEHILAFKLSDLKRFKDRLYLIYFQSEDTVTDQRRGFGIVLLANIEFNFNKSYIV